jgi:hypothetical protein
MNLYEFLNNNDGFMKINMNEFNIMALVHAFNIIEMNGDKVSEIIMSSQRFLELKNKVKENVFESKNVYQKIVDDNELFGVKIVIDKIDKNVIQFNNTSKIPEKSIKLFIND